MIQHVWTVVCSRAVVDQVSNNISLQNVIERVEIGDEPTPGGVLPIELDIMTLWVRADPETPAHGTMRATFKSPDGSVTKGPWELDVDLTEVTHHRCRGHIQGLEVAESGRHAFHIEVRQEDELQWREVAVVPLSIIFTS